MKTTPMPKLFTALTLSALALVSGCASNEKMAAEEFKPIVQLPPEPVAPVTGSIYNGGRNDNWFGRKKDYKVGDIITVILDERTQASRTNNTTASRESTNDVAAGLVPKVPEVLPGFMRPKFNRLTDGLKLDGAEISSESTGSAAQQASLTGSITATVTQVLSNGNLVVRGEKQLSLSEGSETIRVAGIIRSDDVAPDGTVLSRRLANAQISYTGTGDLANANKVPWGTDLLFQIWPF